MIWLLASNLALNMKMDIQSSFLDIIAQKIDAIVTQLNDFLKCF